MSPDSPSVATVIRMMLSQSQLRCFLPLRLLRRRHRSSFYNCQFGSGNCHFDEEGGGEEEERGGPLRRRPRTNLVHGQQRGSFIDTPSVGSVKPIFVAFPFFQKVSYDFLAYGSSLDYRCKTYCPHATPILLDLWLPTHNRADIGTKLKSGNRALYIRN